MAVRQHKTLIWGLSPDLSTYSRQTIAPLTSTSASMGTATWIPVSRAFRISVTTRSRRASSPRKAARFRCPSELPEELGAR